MPTRLSQARDRGRLQRAPYPWAAQLMAAPSFMSPSEIVSPSPRQYRVVIADGHRIVRASVRCLLESAPSISVVAEAEDGEEALSKIEQFQPDVALVDGRDAETEWYRGRSPDCEGSASNSRSGAHRIRGRPSLARVACCRSRWLHREKRSRGRLDRCHPRRRLWQALHARAGSRRTPRSARTSSAVFKARSSSIAPQSCESCSNRARASISSVMRRSCSASLSSNRAIAACKRCY